MTRTADYIQWAHDAATDGEHARAAEFYRLAEREALAADASGVTVTATNCANLAELHDGLANTPKPAKHRTGRRTIRGEAAQGVIIMEFSPPNLITFREKGRRRRYPSTLAALFSFAQRCEARRVQDERIKARKLKKLNKGK